MAGNQIDGIVLITGAAGAIGEATAYAFAEAGATAIAFADINDQKAKEVAEKSKSLAINPEYRARAVAVDITDASSVQRKVDSVVKPERA